MPTSVCDAPPAVLRFEAAPADLAPWVTGFVHRDDPCGGGVMRLLPELRASIQVTLGDRYWLRAEDAPEHAWSPAAQAALWAPRFRPGHGYARRRIHVHAIVLSMDGLRALTGVPASALVDQVVDLAAIRPVLAGELAPRAGEPFHHWRARAERALRTVLADAPVDPRPWPEVLALLAAGGDSTLDAAVARMGLSPRQFRRVFHDRHGATPKAYQRVLRVDRMLRQLHAMPWEHDPFGALPLPFADQPHAIREFRAITGLTPRAYVDRKRSGDLTLRSIPAPGVSPPQQA